MVLIPKFDHDEWLTYFRKLHVRERCVVGHKYGKDNGLKAFVIKADDISGEILEKELRKW